MIFGIVLQDADGLDRTNMEGKLKLPTTHQLCPIEYQQVNQSIVKAIEEILLVENNCGANFISDHFHFSDVLNCPL